MIRPATIQLSKYTDYSSLKENKIAKKWCFLGLSFVQYFQFILKTYFCLE